MASMVYPVSPSQKKWPDPTKETPSPLKGEGGGEGELRRLFEHDCFWLAGATP